MRQALSVGCYFIATFHKMRILINLLFSVLLITACGQTDSNSDNKATNKIDSPVPQKEAIQNSNTLSTLDSIEKTNNKSVMASGNDVTKAYISSQDSSINLTANIRQDHRIFGYTNPDIQSERLILLSIFTNDVKNNPFGCKLGAYYDTRGMEDLNLKYLGSAGEFIKAVAIDKSNKTTTLYFEKKWIEFE